MKDDLHYALNEFHDQARYAETAERRLALLRAFAERNISGKKITRKSRARLRRRFLKTRPRDFARMAPDDWRPCFVCWRPSSHRHHIVAIFVGGDNRPRNWLWVCGPCHERIHPWMSDRPQPLVSEPVITVQKPVLSVEDQLKELQTPAGGWTRATLAKFGVPWPPPKGWKARLIKQPGQRG